MENVKCGMYLDTAHVKFEPILKTRFARNAEMCIIIQKIDLIKFIRTHFNYTIYINDTC